jgi:hypothetical protein
MFGTFAFVLIQRNRYKLSYFNSRLPKTPGYKWRYGFDAL